MDKVIFHSARLKCDVNKAFEMFTANEHFEKWLTEVADVDGSTNRGLLFLRSFRNA
jgi:hypothetical protein